MIDLNLKTKTRTQPFFGQWRYYALFHLPEAHVLRKLDHDHIDRCIKSRQAWAARNINWGGSWYRSAMTITNDTISDLHGVCDFLLEDETPRKITVCSNQFYVYSNDLGLFERLVKTGQARLEKIVEAQLSGTPGTVVLKNPNHKLRSYFRDCELDHKIRDSVIEFLNNQTGVRLSPSLKHWMSIQYRFTAPYYFIDHDDTGITLMLNMIAPGLIRKTVGIEAAK